MQVFEKCANFTVARDLRAAGLYPYFQRITESYADTEVVIDGHRKVMIGSNNYMGLTHDPRIIEAAKAALDTYGSGYTGSRFLNGNLDMHDQLEEELADFIGKEAALVFSTGYQTNLGAIGALVGRGDTVFLDKLDHACLQDGARLSFGQTERFRHDDYDSSREPAGGDGSGSWQAGRRRRGVQHGRRHRRSPRTRPVGQEVSMPPSGR